jgi:hypothetical protein
MTSTQASLAFETYLQNQPAEIQTGALLWLWASQGEQGISGLQSNALQQVLKSLEMITSEEGVAILSRQSLSDVVGWTMIHEFGPAIKDKSVFSRLVPLICQRLQANSTIQAMTA